MANKDSDAQKVIVISESTDEGKKDFALISDRDNDKHPGTFIIEVREVKK